MGLTRDPAAIAAICGHTPPRPGCHLCKLAGRKVATATGTTAKKSPCGCGTCADCPPVVAAYAAPEPTFPPFVPGVSSAAALPRWRPVPPPSLAPTRDRLVLTAVIGDDADQLHAATGPGQRAYAERVGAEYVVLRDRTQDERMSCAEKWRARDYVPHYPGGTLWLDADVFVLPDAPDIFAATPPDRIGLVDVGPRTPNLLEWATAESARVSASQGVPDIPQAKYWNSGVWVGRPDHADYWTPCPFPYPAEWCVEELWCRRTVAALGLPVHDLDPRFNWTWPEDRRFETWADRRPWFAHLAGMGNMDVPGWVQPNKVWRLALLRLLAAVAR